MHAVRIVRAPFGGGGATGEEFVDYPITALNRGWEGKEVDVAVEEVEAVEAGGDEASERMVLHGNLLHRGGGFCVYSCGGLLARLRDTGRENVSISVTLRRNRPGNKRRKGEP